MLHRPSLSRSSRRRTIVALLAGTLSCFATTTDSFAQSSAGMSPADTSPVELAPVAMSLDAPRIVASPGTQLESIPAPLTQPTQNPSPAKAPGNDENIISREPKALASGFSRGPTVLSAPAASAVGSVFISPAPPADVEIQNEEIQGPTNSTLEIRVARRPWLLDKIIGPKTEPSVKMDPPIPPADLPDPPSMSRILPKPADGGWVPRGTIAVQRRATRETAKTREPLPKSMQHVPTPQNVVSQKSASQKSAPQTTVPREATGRGTAVPEKTAAPERIAVPVYAEPANETRADVPPVEPRTTSVANDATTDDTAAPSPRTTEVKTAESSTTSVITEASKPITNDSVESKLKSPHKEMSLRRPNIDASGNAVKSSPVTIDTNEDHVADAIPAGRAASEDEAQDAVIEKVAPKIQRDYAGYPKQPIRLMNPAARMKNTMRQTLRYYYGRPEIANERSNWGMMHSIMVYGIDTRVLVGRKSYSAVAWVAGNNACRGQRILEADANGDIAARSGIGLQGHQAQLLAVLSLCNVPIDYTLYADEYKYTVRDLIKSEMRACKSGEELTFTLIGLAHYLDTEAVWKNAEGEIWDFERLIREELGQPIVGVACGGTHRLMGYAHALRKRREEGRSVTGQWKRAEVYTNDFVKYAYRLQNRDGSMSTDWFEGREDNGDLDRKVQTTGHMVEWLLTLTPDSQLQNARLVSAMRFLTNAMYKERRNEWKIGPKGHALRCLAMYYQRVYQSGPAWQNGSVARSSTRSSRKSHR